MRGLVQRVQSAHVDVVTPDGSRHRSGEIGPGLCVLVGVTHSDTEADAEKLADKLWGLRVFDDDHGVMNRSLSDLHVGSDKGDGQIAAAVDKDAPRPEILVVSQFTLYGDTRKGRRPSWIAAARPEHAEPLVERVVDRLSVLGAIVATGRFRTQMEVGIVNDGPVTVLLEVPPSPVPVDDVSST